MAGKDVLAHSLVWGDEGEYFGSAFCHGGQPCLGGSMSAGTVTCAWGPGTCLGSGVFWVRLQICLPHPHIVCMFFFFDDPFHHLFVKIDEVDRVN